MLTNKNDISDTPNSNPGNKLVYFSKVIIHGCITNFVIKEFRNGRKSIRLSINTSNQIKSIENDREEPTDYMPADLDVYVEKKQMIQKSKNWLNIGQNVMLDGRIVLLFIRNNEKIVKKVQYISIDNIICSKSNRTYSKESTEDRMD